MSKSFYSGSGEALLGETVTAADDEVDLFIVARPSLTSLHTPGVFGEGGGRVEPGWRCGALAGLWPGTNA